MRRFLEKNSIMVINELSLYYNGKLRIMETLEMWFVVILNLFRVACHRPVGHDDQMYKLLLFHSKLKNDHTTIWSLYVLLIVEAWNGSNGHKVGRAVSWVLIRGGGLRGYYTFECARMFLVFFHLQKCQVLLWGPVIFFSFLKIFLEPVLRLRVTIQKKNKWKEFSGHAE